jgi:A/G-specific adenine glycosylase
VSGNSLSLGRAATRIIEWGRSHSDDFPWREPRSAYASAVAEIMLIRTPPEQVLPVYERFLSKYPDVATLAQAEVGDIAALIKPLGLRWRAERLSSMARHICQERGGSFPDTQEELEGVPGIGPYAAAAVLLFYYGRRGVLVDANSVRLIERYSGRAFSGEARRNKELIGLMDQLTPDDHAAARCFANGFLDFMRRMCSPAQPACDECFLSSECHYGQQRVRSSYSG